MMSYWILPKSGYPISCATVQKLTNLEMQTEAWKDKMRLYNLEVNERLDAQAAEIAAPNAKNSCMKTCLETTIFNVQQGTLAAIPPGSTLQLNPGSVAVPKKKKS